MNANGDRMLVRFLWKYVSLSDMDHWLQRVWWHVLYSTVRSSDRKTKVTRRVDLASTKDILFGLTLRRAGNRECFAETSCFLAKTFVRKQVPRGISDLTVFSHWRVCSGCIVAHFFRRVVYPYFYLLNIAFSLWDVQVGNQQTLYPQMPWISINLKERILEKGCMQIPWIAKKLQSV